MNLAPVKRRRERIHGVLLLDKPLEISSNGALGAAKRLLNADKAGHTGTLDPLATGLLPVLFGDATKFSADLLDADKAYEAVVHLGITTTTGDREGEVLQQRPVAVTVEQIGQAMATMLGEQMQVPPMYSALKHQGRPLYDYARQGVSIDRPARQVRIERFVVLAVDLPLITVAVDCSKGTYVRTLAEDLGEKLGCGAHLQALRRTRVGRLSLDQAVTLASLELLDESQRRQVLKPVDYLLAELPAMHLSDKASLQFGNGMTVKADGGTQQAGLCRVYDQHAALMGLGRLDAYGWLKPERLVQRDASG